MFSAVECCVVIAASIVDVEVAVVVGVGYESNCSNICGSLPVDFLNKKESVVGSSFSCDGVFLGG